MIWMGYCLPETFVCCFAVEQRKIWAVFSIVFLFTVLNEGWAWAIMVYVGQDSTRKAQLWQIARKNGVFRSSQ